MRREAPKHTPHPNPPPQGGRGFGGAFEMFPLPPCGGGSGRGVRQRTGEGRVARWHRHERGSCGAIQRRRKDACGRSSDSNKLVAIVFAAKCPSDLTSSISSASPGGSSSRSMVGSMATELSKTGRERHGWSDRDSASGVSGTTRCSAISKAFMTSSSHILRAASPHPNPPPQGGRGFAHAFDIFPLPPCEGGSGWGVSRRAGFGATTCSAKRQNA